MAYMTGKDFLLLPDGSTYHLGAKKGEIYPRILTVGSVGRADVIAKHLDVIEKTIDSNRGFHIVCGKYKDVGVSIIAIGMGAPMMDFMMREVSYCENGPMAVIRLGTCGILNPEIKPGTLMCAGEGSMYCYVNYSAFSGCENDENQSATAPKYLLSKPVSCDRELNELLVKSLSTSKYPISEGLNCCGETFYACQGRKDPNFEDENEFILPAMRKAGVDFVEMETHQLFHLAAQRKTKCAAAACCIGIVNRTNNEMKENIPVETLHNMESAAGKSCLETLVNYPVESLSSI